MIEGYCKPKKISALKDKKKPWDFTYELSTCSLQCCWVSIVKHVKDGHRFRWEAQAL